MKRGGPRDAIDGTHAAEVGVPERLRVVDLLDHRVADPDMGADVDHRRIGPAHDPEEDRTLLGHEQGRERQAAQEHRQFGAVSEEHVESEAIHR